MSSSPIKGDTPQAYYDVLYAEDDDIEDADHEDSKDEIVLIDPDEVDVYELDMPGPSSEPQFFVAGSGISTMNIESMPVILSDALAFTTPSEQSGEEPEEMEEDDAFPAVEVVYNYPSMTDEYESTSALNVESKSRGSARGGRRGGVRRGSGVIKRARGQVRGRGRGNKSAWKRGQSLIEIFATNEDVPPALSSMVAEIVRMREERAKQLREKRMRSEAEKQSKRAGDDLDSEEFYEADDGRDASLLADMDKEFRWSPMNTFHGCRETFEVPVTGPTQPQHTMYGAFRSYWTDDILTHIVSETNKYAGLICTAGNPSYSASFAKDWYATNIYEILMLFAFWMMLGIIRMPTLKSCFTMHPLMKTDVFRKMFSSKRFSNLTRALHFCDNDAQPTTSSGLYKLDTILTHLNLKFKENYIPSQNVCIDESLTLWKGQLIFKQYIKTKSARYGIKTFELCESATGYLCSFIVYTGKSVEEPLGSSILKSTSVVLRLIQPYLDKGYTLFMDNWFNAPVLARFLKSRKTDCVGTLRSNRKDVPALVTLTDLCPGQYIARHSGDICVEGWFDRQKVLTISTYHGCETGTVITGRGNNRTTIYKPQVILDYNKNMGGVDLKDQMLEPYLIERKRGAKWYIKLFKRLLNCSINNSRIMVTSTKGQAIDNLVSRLCLVDEILSKHAELVPRLNQRRSVPAPVKSERDQGLHWPMLISTERDNHNRKARRRCVWCYKTSGANSRTPFQCEQCQVGLCIPCFKPFHVHREEDMLSQL